MDAAGKQDRTVSRRPGCCEDCDSATRARAILNSQPMRQLFAKGGRDWPREAVDPSAGTVSGRGNRKFRTDLRNDRYAQRSMASSRKLRKPPARSEDRAVLDAALVAVARALSTTRDASCRLSGCLDLPRKPESTFENCGFRNVTIRCYLLQNSLIHQLHFPVSLHREFSKSRCRAGTFG